MSKLPAPCLYDSDDEFAHDLLRDALLARPSEVRGWGKNTQPFESGHGDTRRKSIGWARWDYVPTIKRDDPTDDAAKHRFSGGPGSVSDAT